MQWACLEYPWHAAARDDSAVDSIVIADEVARSLIPRKCLRYLTRHPFGRGICCDVDPDEVSAAEPDDDEGIEQSKPIVGTTNRSMAASTDVNVIFEPPPTAVRVAAR